jgi:hypothetical protein
LNFVLTTGSIPQFTVNVALQQTTWQSNSAIADGASAVDGYASTCSTVTSHGAADTWLAVDLGGQTFVQSLKLVYNANQNSTTLALTFALIEICAHGLRTSLR